VRPAFRVRRKAAVLYLDLDTPDSRVNILTPEAREELEHILKGIDPKRTRAVVLQSRKPHSFINGTRLLHATSVHSHEEASRVALEVRRTYTALGACPVPTIAAIEGSCFGCGLELTLYCDHRVASDAFDTELYLTEISDYLFTPVFGATQKLPPLIGLANAIDVVILGKRLRAEEARAIGLIDRVFSHRRFGAELSHFIDAIAAEKPRKRRSRSIDATSDEAARREAHRRIRAMPKEVRPIYRAALSLLDRALDRSLRESERTKLEIDACAETVTTPASIKAMSYFFVRQASELISAGEAGPLLQRRFAIGFDSARATDRLRRILEARPIAGVTYGGKKPNLILGTQVGVAYGECTDTTAVATAHEATLYFPFPPEDDIACEVALPKHAPGPPAGLIPFLGLAGFTSIVTRPSDAFVSERLIDAYREAAGDARALSAFGFLRPLRSLGVTARPARMKAPVIRVLAHLLAESLRCLDEGALEHRAQADVLARVLFGFPLHRGSLFQMLEAPEGEAIADAIARILGPREKGPRRLLASLHPRRPAPHRARQPRDR
jgi:enoyl-CoA hydratase/carnithine racemase